MEAHSGAVEFHGARRGDLLCVDQRGRRKVEIIHRARGRPHWSYSTAPSTTPRRWSPAAARPSSSTAGAPGTPGTARARPRRARRWCCGRRRVSQVGNARPRRPRSGGRPSRPATAVGRGSASYGGSHGPMIPRTRLRPVEEARPDRAEFQHERRVSPGTPPRRLAVLPGRGPPSNAAPGRRFRCRTSANPCCSSARRPAWPPAPAAAAPAAPGPPGWPRDAARPSGAVRVPRSTGRRYGHAWPPPRRATAGLGDQLVRLRDGRCGDVGPFHRLGAARRPHMRGDDGRPSPWSNAAISARRAPRARPGRGCLCHLVNAHDLPTCFRPGRRRRCRPFRPRRARRGPRRDGGPCHSRLGSAGLRSFAALTAGPSRSTRPARIRRATSCSSRSRVLNAVSHAS